MRLPGFEWLGPVPNRSPGGAPNPSLGLILHVIVGSIEAANGVFHSTARPASAHFGAGKAGRRVQWVDTDDKAWAQAAGNSSYHSIETEGFPNEALTDAQVETVAVVYAWGHARYGWPFQLANRPGERGLGTHSMGGAAWGGHACPGDIRAGQRQRILNRAAQLAGGAPPSTQQTQAQRRNKIQAGNPTRSVI